MAEQVQIRIVADTTPLQAAFDEVMELLARLWDELLRVELGRKTLPW